MAILWTELVAPCERDIHNDFTKQGKRLVDNKGRHARGGIEWFKDELTQSLPAIYQWVIHYRNPVSSKELVLSVPGFYSDLGDPSLHFSISRPVKNPRGQEQFSSLSRREKSQKKDNKNKSKPLTISCIRIDKYGGENIEFGCLECSVKVYIQKICAVKFRTSKVVVRLTNGQRHSFCVRSKGQVDSVLSFVQEAKWRLIEKEGIKTYIAPTVGQQIKQRAVF